MKILSFMVYDKYIDKGIFDYINNRTKMLLLK